MRFLMALTFSALFAADELKIDPIQVDPIQKIDPGPKVDPIQRIDPGNKIDSGPKVDPIVIKSPPKGAAPAEAVKRNVPAPVDVKFGDTDQSGHSTGADETSSAIISNLIEEEKHNHPNELPTAESLGIGGPKLTDLAVKVPDVPSSPSRDVQVFIPEGPIPPNKKKPANAGAGRC